MEGQRQDWDVVGRLAHRAAISAPCCRPTWVQNNTPNAIMPKISKKKTGASIANSSAVAPRSSSNNFSVEFTATSPWTEKRSYRYLEKIHKAESYCRSFAPKLSYTSRPELLLDMCCHSLPY